MTELTLEQMEQATGGTSSDREYFRYKVQRGDTLDHLARVYHTTVDELLRINHLANKNKLFAGDYLLIPKV